MLPPFHAAAAAAGSKRFNGVPAGLDVKLFLLFKVGGGETRAKSNLVRAGGEGGIELRIAFGVISHTELTPRKGSGKVVLL